MKTTKPLRSVARVTPAPVVADAARAARVYANAPTLAEKWLAAVAFMQARPGGSIWILDTNRPPTKWRSTIAPEWRSNRNQRGIDG